LSINISKCRYKYVNYFFVSLLSAVLDGPIRDIYKCFLYHLAIALVDLYLDVKCRSLKSTD